MIRKFQIIVNGFKIIIFFIALIILCSKNSSQEESLLKDSSIRPAISYSNYLEQSEDNQDILALKEARPRDIKNLRSLKRLDIEKEQFIKRAIESPGVISYEIIQQPMNNGILEVYIPMLLQGSSSLHNNPEAANCYLTLYNYRSHMLAMNFSQLIPFENGELKLSSAHIQDFLKSFLDEDSSELQDTIISFVSDSLPELSKTNNSSQSYCFIYGNYGVNLSLHEENSIKGTSLILNIYIYLNQ